MARETLVQKRATKLEKLKALQAEIDGLNEKAAMRIGDLAIRAGLADLNVSDSALVKEFRAIAARLGQTAAEPEGGSDKPANRARSDAA
jgi:hypothetical protein